MRNLRNSLYGLIIGAVVLPGAAWAQASLNPAIRAYNEGQFDRAAVNLYDFIAVSGQDGDRAKAEFYLAQTLEKMRLYQGALYHYNQIVNAGPAHPYYVPAIEGMVQVAEALDDDLAVPAFFNKEYNDDFQRLRPEFLHKVNYMVGLVSSRTGQLDDAEAFLGVVPKDSSYFARARYLLGIVEIQKGQRGGSPEALDEASHRAVAYFHEVLGLQGNYVELKDLRDLARLGLGRTYYGLGDYAQAVKYYEEVPRFSQFWDQALFENGWARFLNDDFGGALGSLQALHAPQFAGSFQPESWILKATIYYQACLYDEAKAAIDTYRSSYSQTVQGLQPILASERELSYFYRLIRDTQEMRRLPRSVYHYLGTNRRVRGFDRYIAALDREEQTLRSLGVFKNSALQAELLQTVQQQRNLMQSVAGNFVKGRLDDAMATVQGFDGKAEIILFETSKAEGDRITRGVDYQTSLANQTLLRPMLPGEDWEYWNFQGEFWIDEIGYYQFTLKSGCAQPAED